MEEARGDFLTRLSLAKLFTSLCKGGMCRCPSMCVFTCKNGLTTWTGHTSLRRGHCLDGSVARELVLHSSPYGMLARRTPMKKEMRECDFHARKSLAIS